MSIDIGYSMGDDTGAIFQRCTTIAEAHKALDELANKLRTICESENK